MDRRRALALPALVLAAALAVAAVLAGCGSAASSGTGSAPRRIDTDVTSASAPNISAEPNNQGSPGGTARLDPCSLLSDADITAAGGKGGTHAPDTNDFGAGCNYGLVRLYPTLSQGQFDFHTSSERVAGVGEEAWLDTNLHQLRFRTATHRLIIVCVLCPDDGSSTLPKLANTVIGNLPG